MIRLCTEERLSGDDMRNLAQRLHVALNNLMDSQEPKPAKRQNCCTQSGVARSPQARKRRRRPMTMIRFRHEHDEEEAQDGIPETGIVGRGKNRLPEASEDPQGHRFQDGWASAEAGAVRRGLAQDSERCRLFGGHCEQLAKPVQGWQSPDRPVPNGGRRLERGAPNRHPNWRREGQDLTRAEFEKRLRLCGDCNV